MKDSNDSLWRRVFGGVFWTLTSSSGSQIINLLVTVVLARILGPSDFGTVTGAYVMAMSFAAFIDLGCADPLVRARNKSAIHYDTMFWTFIGSSVFLGFLIVSLSSTISNLIGQPQIRGPLVVFGVALPLTAVTALLTAKLRAELKFRTLAIRSLFAAAFGGALGIGSAALGFGFWSLVIRTVSESLAGVAILLASNPYRPKMRFSTQVFADLFMQGRHLLLRNLLDVINTRADSIIISARLGAAQLGQYAAAQRVHQAIVDSVSGVAGVLLPAFGRIQEDPDRVQRAYFRVLKTIATLAFPLFMFISALGEPVVLFLLGDKWSGCSPIVSVLAFGGVLLTVNWINSTIMIAVGRADYQFRLAMLNSPLNLLAFLLGSNWGAIGVACGLVLRTYIVFPVNVTLLRRATGIGSSKVIAEILPPFFVALAVAAIIHECDRVLLWEFPAIVRLISGVLVGTTGYCLGAIVFFKSNVIEILGELGRISPRLETLCKRIQGHLRS